MNETIWFIWTNLDGLFFDGIDGFFGGHLVLLVSMLHIFFFVTLPSRGQSLSFIILFQDNFGHKTNNEIAEFTAPC